MTLAATYPTSRPGFLSFKGRSTRQEYWTMVAVLVGINLAIWFLLHRVPGVGGVIAVFWIRTYTRRLHDIGQSGWMQCVLYFAQVVAILAGLIWAWPDLMAAVRMGYRAEQLVESAWPIGLGIIASSLMQVGYTIWLGCKAGEAEENRFGPSPRPQEVAGVFA